MPHPNACIPNKIENFVSRIEHRMKNNFGNFIVLIHISDCFELVSTHEFPVLMVLFPIDSHLIPWYPIRYKPFGLCLV